LLCVSAVPVPPTFGRDVDPPWTDLVVVVGDVVADSVEVAACSADLPGVTPAQNAATVSLCSAAAAARFFIAREC
jgi:hypothetical protein